MKNLTRRVSEAWSSLPLGVRKEAKHLGIVFVATFAATAHAAFPGLIHQLQLGHLPSFGVVSALVVACVTVSIKATLVATHAALKQPKGI